MIGITTALSQSRVVDTFPFICYPFSLTVRSDSCSGVLRCGHSVLSGAAEPAAAAAAAPPGSLMEAQTLWAQLSSPEAYVPL